MADTPDEHTKLDDLMAGYTGPNRKKTAASSSHRRDDKPASQDKDKVTVKSFLLGTVAILIMGAAAANALSRFSSIFGGSSRNDAAIEACRWEMVSIGFDLERYDFQKAYVRDVYNETNAPVPTQVYGMPIKCVLVPRLGAKPISGGCPMFNPPAKDHWACRLVYDDRQDIWITPSRAEQLYR